MSETTHETPAPDAPAEWHLADGTAYRGEVFEDAQGKPFGEAWVSCPSCAGNGRSRGRQCKACGGDGESWDQVRLVSAADQRAKERRRDATRARTQAKADVREAGRKAAWEAFSAAEAPLIARIRASDNAFAQDVLAKVENWGGMTDKQREAVVAALDKDVEDRAVHARSAPFGEVGDKVEVDVTCRRRSSFLGKGYAGSGTREVFITEMLDDAGNAFSVVSQSFSLDPGDRARVSGTVKEHDLKRRAWCQTVLTRAKALSRVPAPGRDAEPEEAPAPAGP